VSICHSTSAQLGHAHRWRTLPASDSLSAVRTATTTLFPNLAALQARSHLCASSNCLYSTWRAFQRSSDPVTFVRRRRVAMSSQHQLVSGPYCRSHTDRYVTQAAQLKLLVASLEITGSVLDPCGGSSDVVSQLLPALTQCEVLCNDIDVNVPASSHGDAYRAEFWDSIADPPDWIIGSPPYAAAARIVRHAIGAAKVGVAFKLRLSFLEPCADRIDLLQNCPPSSMLVLPRTTYSKQICGSSRDWMCEAWFVWRLSDLESKSTKPISVVSREDFERCALE